MSYSACLAAVVRAAWRGHGGEQYGQCVSLDVYWTDSSFHFNSYPHSFENGNEHFML